MAAGVRPDQMKSGQQTVTGAASSIAIVGCGAIVEQSYLPALRACVGVTCDMLVDPDRSRVEELAAQYGIPSTAASLEDVPTAVQGIVVAVPNNLHLEVVTGALRRGAHVLCEKPLGRSLAEVNEMVAASIEHSRGLFAAMVCRRYPAVRDAVKYRLSDMVGDLQEIDAAYGFPLDWPVQSLAYYDRTQSGGGALLDFGAHLIDALFYVVGDPPFEVVSYADDAEAGVDAEAEGHITLLLAHGRVECTIRASRLRRLSNALILRGANGTLEIPLSPAQTATFHAENGSWPVSGHVGGSLQCFADQLEDFGRAIREEPHELPAAASQRASIGLIEQLYALRQPLTLPWDA